MRFGKVRLARGTLAGARIRSHKHTEKETHGAAVRAEVIEFVSGQHKLLTIYLLRPSLLLREGTNHR